jgi:ribosomal protein S12 methylthiotransferase
MLAGLALGGFAVTGDADGADVVVVNTCAFIDLARAESDQHLDRLESLKAAGWLGHIVVAGCMAQRYGRRVLARHGGVDAVVGLADRDALAEVCRGLLGPKGGQPVVRVRPHAAHPPDDRERLRLTPRHYAYIRISEGCDNRCAYCAIPEIRGPLRSKPPEQVLAEAEELVRDGAKELILIGQDTTAYGRDFATPHSLGRLLRECRERLRVPWLRLMYTHPASFSEDVIAELAAGPPLVPYVDLPLQHASDRVLASMGRRVDHAAIEDLVGRLRAAVPGLAIRTSFIVGYPGETDAEFGELVAFVEKVRFDHVGVFVYSPEPGTRAADLPGRVEPEVARRRWDHLMAAAERLAHEAARQRTGQTLEVLVDGRDESGRLVARHAGQAPDVDSVVLLAPGAAAVGQMARVRIIGTEGYDLVGEVI